jgi:BolA family transcriptional regulator, general stress-responsive regulator
MNRYERLKALLHKTFPTANILLIDDSAEHAGHAHGLSGETHYRLQISDATFAGLSAVQKHRLILQAVRSETDAGMHSFVIERAEAS